MPHLTTVDSLAFGGDAVARVDGKVAFIPSGAPGDQLRVRVLQQHASFVRAEILDILQAGPSRRDPVCPLFGRCGGCQWQHVRYPDQSRAKRQIVADALRPVATGGWRMCEAPEEWRYRRRARLRWRVDRAGVLLGFLQAGSSQLIDVPSCPLLADPLEQALPLLRTWLGSAAQGSRGTAVLLCGSEGMVHASVRVERGSVATPQDLCGGHLVGCALSSGRGPWQDFGQTTLKMDQRGLESTAVGFSQANDAQDAVLRSELLRHAQPLAGARVLELFAGAGNLTLDLMHSAGSLAAVESEETSARLLRRNVEHRGGEVQVRRQPAGEALNELCAGGARFDLVVLDPPRQGARQVTEQLAELGPERIVYVSCDPMTLARDLACLSAQGYEVADGSIVDMMPQTFHVELVVQLRRVAPRRP